MRKVALVLFLASTAASGQSLSSCWDKALTQAAMNACASADCRRAEAELNRSHDLLLARTAATHPAAVPKIKAAQQAWVAYREAQIEAMFAADDKQAAYGTVYSMCILQLRARLAAQRTKELQVMMTLPESGVVCHGDRYAPPEPQ